MTPHEPSWRPSGSSGPPTPAKCHPTDPGPDFRDAAGFVVFRPGETTHDVTRRAVRGHVDEPNETYYVDLEVATADDTVVTNGRGDGTITDDDTGTITINDVTVVEGDADPS